jgi:hypothetical protein
MTEAKPSDQSPCKNDRNKEERKLSVLESRGYVLGKTIGVGTYATVKVNTKLIL